VDEFDWKFESAPATTYWGIEVQDALSITWRIKHDYASGDDESDDNAS
jgi:hypothetical protein